MENNTFHYNYSARRNTEVERIRNKYLPKAESKLEELIRLDKQVEEAGLLPALVLGVVGALVFGIGLCFCLGVLGDSLVIGVLLGALGAAVMMAAYPVYRRLLAKTKKKNASRILTLSAELMQQTEA